MEVLVIQGKFEQVVQAGSGETDHVISRTIVYIDVVIYNNICAGKDHIWHVAAQFPYLPGVKN